MSATCPVCFAEQAAGLLCSNCCDRLRTDLRGNASIIGVAELVDNLHIAQAKQARLGGGTGQAAQGTKHERLPLNLGAMEAARHLEHILGSWAMDVTGEEWWPVQGRYVAVEAADTLLDHMDDIRRHGAVKDLVEEVTQAVNGGRNTLDVEPFSRFPVGPCPEDDCTRTVFAVCPAEGSHRPALMACYQMVTGENRPDLGAGFTHSYSSVQFYRVGVRIRRKLEARDKGAA